MSISRYGKWYNGTQCTCELLAIYRRFSALLGIKIRRPKTLIWATKLLSTFVLSNNKPIKICKEYHYLGITFSASKNRFKTHFTQKRDKALNAIFAARKTVRETVGLQSLHLQLKILDTQIQPIYNYGLEIWYTGKQVDEFETLHLCYIKRPFGIKISTSTLAVFGEIWRFPLILQRKESILKYWFRLL